jgi:hypothetical protein
MERTGVSHIPLKVITAFLTRAGMFGLAGAFNPENTVLLDNPTEEILDGMQRKGKVRLFARGVNTPWMGARNVATQVHRRAGSNGSRLEENYLYSTRRFPALTNSTIGGGAIVANSYAFFQYANGQNCDSAGFPTGTAAGLTETNMEVASQVAQGTNFVFNQVGISFNAMATTTNVAQLMDACALIFSKQGGQFTLNHGPIKAWPGGMGLAGFSNITAAATEVSAHNGAADIRAVRSLKIPRVIREKETFAYNFVVPRATTATDFTAFALTQFVLATVWLWGGQENIIPV